MIHREFEITNEYLIAAAKFLGARLEGDMIVDYDGIGGRKYRITCWLSDTSSYETAYVESIDKTELIMIRGMSKEIVERVERELNADDTVCWLTTTKQN